MKEIKRLHTAFKSVLEEEIIEETIFITSDGREFVDEAPRSGRLTPKMQAQNHQNYLDGISSLKEEIKYKKVELLGPLSFCYDICHFDSFTFELNKEKIQSKFYLLNDILPPDFKDVRTLPDGKYLAIIYRQNHETGQRDWYSYSGYFGTVEDYLEKLHLEMNIAHSI